jgi:hypothetical protein
MVALPTEAAIAQTFICAPNSEVRRKAPPRVAKMYCTLSIRAAMPILSLPSDHTGGSKIPESQFSDRMSDQRSGCSAMRRLEIQGGPAKKVMIIITSKAEQGNSLTYLVVRIARDGMQQEEYKVRKDHPENTEDNVFDGLIVISGEFEFVFPDHIA